MELPEKEFTLAKMIDREHEKNRQAKWLHLGVSQLGEKCDRAIWYAFRWASEEKFSGRMLRLFRRGQNEETTVCEDLKLLGCDLINTGKNQRRVHFGAHVSGSLDGIIKSGLPGSEKTEHILEIKTHNLKSFEALEKNGVEIAKPEHFIQMQGYMLGTGIGRALYFAVCKDDDRIYTERVKFDQVVATKYIERAKRIALSDRAPEPISVDSTWFKCKFCSSHDLCFGSKKTNNVNCRTCARSTACEDSTWYCEKWKSEIPGNHQELGCDSHVLHPDLVPWKLVAAECLEDVAAYDVGGGRIIKNGPGNVLSRELVVDGATDADAQKVRAIFGAEIVENA